MKKTVLAMMVAMVSLFLVACPPSNNAAGNNAAKCKDGGAKCGTPAADAWALYRKKGNKWVHKMVTKMQGMDDMVSYMENEVISVDDKAAKVKMTMMDKDKKAMAGMAPTENEIKFETPKAADKPADKPVEMKKETIKVAAGEFECYVTETEAGGSKTKSWSSVKYPGLAVKSETTGSANSTMELIEWTEGK